jgi:hypothetical protein
MEIVLLVLVGVIGILVFIALFIWNVVFGQSLRKMLMTFVGIAVDRGSLVDPDAPIDIRRDDLLSSEFDRKADAIKAQSVLNGQDAPAAIPQAQIAASEQLTPASATSDNGWPRALDEETRGQPRAFRHLHLRTDYEQTLDADAPDAPSADAPSR